MSLTPLKWRGSLRSQTPEDGGGGVFKVSHAWRWKGRGHSGLSRLEVEGEGSFRSLTPRGGWGGVISVSHMYTITWREHFNPSFYTSKRKFTLI